MRLHLVTAVAAAAIGLCACGGSGEQSTPPSTAAKLPSVTDLGDAGARRAEDVGTPDWLVVAEGSAWAAGVGDGVGRFDGATGKLLGSVAVPGEVCLAMDVGFDSIWVGSCGEPQISRIDPRTAKVVATIELAVDDLAVESSLAAGEGGVWALSSGSDAKLLKIDPQTNKVAATYPAPAGSAAIRAAFGALWVTNDDGTLLRLDPEDGSVITKIRVGTGPRFLAVGEGGVWVLNQADGSVSHVDPETNKVVATISVDGSAVDGGDIATGGGAVWARVSDSLVAKIDPETDAVVARYGPASGSGSVAADEHAAWISAHDVHSVWRLALP
jgi:virginiamycin B lyase